ncbi:MAG: hypothetical protein IKI99_00075, partial [Firmicutes bacterium]|nr:hypothetical protein [Bacillota bacterium]
MKHHIKDPAVVFGNHGACCQLRGSSAEVGHILCNVVDGDVFRSCQQQGTGTPWRGRSSWTPPPGSWPP